MLDESDERQQITSLDEDDDEVAYEQMPLRPIDETGERDIHLLSAVLR